MPPDDVRQALTEGDGDVQQAQDAPQGREPQDEPISAGRDRWHARFDAARTRDADFTTLSGVEVEPVYGPDDGAVVPGFERIGWPGEFPFTRGLYPTGYRGRPWTIRQFAGFGNAEQTNERYKMILGRAAAAGSSVAFDMPTLMGRDSDDPRSLGEVGHCGVAIDSAADMDVLFDGIPLGDVTTSMTISGPAVPIFCMYLVAAERQGVDLGDARRHPADRHLQGVHRPEGVAVPARAAPAPDRRPDGVLRRRRSRRTSRCRSPATTSARPARPPRRSSPSRSPTASATSSWACSRGLDVDVFAPGLSLLLRRAHRLLRGDRQVPRRPPDLGALDARRLRRHDREGPVAALPHPDRRASR